MRSQPGNKFALKHGHTRRDGYRSPEYHSWDAMIGRCHRPNAQSFRAYGARGLVVCERWHIFENFLADMGPRPAGTTLERRDNTKGYLPGNGRWATPREQGQNKRGVRLVTIDAVTKTVREWSDASGISFYTLSARLKVGDQGAALLRKPHRSGRKPRNTLVDQLDGVTR